MYTLILKYFFLTYNIKSKFSKSKSESIDNLLLFGLFYRSLITLLLEVLLTVVANIFNSVQTLTAVDNKMSINKFRGPQRKILNIRRLAMDITSPGKPYIIKVWIIYKTYRWISVESLDCVFSITQVQVQVFQNSNSICQVIFITPF